MSDWPSVHASAFSLSSVPLLAEHVARHEYQLSVFIKKCAVAWSREMALMFIGLHKIHEHLVNRDNIKRKAQKVLLHLL